MVPLTKNTFYKEEATKKALCEFILGAKQLSIGAQCEQFEEAFAAWQGRKYGILFNSGSSANLALFRALMNIQRLKKGDRVAFSALTWPTNVMPIIQMGLHPIAIDVELETLNVSLAQVQAAYEQHPFTCLFITNLLGFCGDIDKIAEFCRERNILFLEDNCEALGSEYKGVKLGNFSAASTFSFFVGHHMSTIEGGMVTTDDKELAVMLKMVRSHGWNRHLHPDDRVALRETHNVHPFYDRYTFYDLAYNLRPTDIQGFLGLSQLVHLDEIIRNRVRNYERLAKVYENPDFHPIETTMDVCSNFAFPVICKSKELQEKYIARCIEAGIEHRPIVGGSMPEQPFYKKHVDLTHALKNAAYIHGVGFYVGNNADMTDEEIDIIVAALSQ